ncbi:MAG: DciA family protein [Pseudomonadota bacterium]
MARRLSELLQDLPAVRQAQALAALQKHFDAALPARFRGEAQVVALEEGELRILCRNGAIASRLRLEAQNLADALQKRGLAVRRVSVKVQPGNSRKAPPPRSKQPLPAAAKQAFESASEAMEEGEVKAALQKLLRHHQPR